MSIEAEGQTCCTCVVGRKSGLTVEWCDCRYHYPPDCNPADYWLSVISAEPDETAIVDKQRIDHLVYCFQDSEVAGMLQRHPSEDEYVPYSVYLVLVLMGMKMNVGEYRKKEELGGRFRG